MPHHTNRDVRLTVESSDGEVLVDKRVWAAVERALGRMASHPADSCTGGASDGCSIAAPVLDLLTDDHSAHVHRELWDSGLAALTAFASRLGHTVVPGGHVEDGVPLADWVARIRAMRRVLPAERVTALEELRGWHWGLAELLFEGGYPHMHAFASREGHCDVPARHLEGGYPLHGWRETHSRALWILDDDRRQRLTALPGWKWSPSRSWNADDELNRLAESLDEAFLWRTDAA